MAVASALLLVLSLIRSPGPEWGVAGVLGGVTLGIGAVIEVARRGHVRPAGIILSAVVIVGVVLGQLVRQQVGYAPFFLVLAVLVAAVTLEPRDVGIVTGVATGALALMSVVGQGYVRREEAAGTDLINSAVLFALISSVAWLMAVGVQRLLRDLVQQEHDAEVAREEARRSSARAEIIAQNSADLVSLLDHDGNVLWASASHQRILGAEGATLNAAEFRRQLFHPDDVHLLDEAFKAAVGGRTGSSQLRVRRADGSFGWYQSLMTPVPGEKLIVASTRDVSEVRALSAQLEASQKMEALGRLAGGVAHDFNNLLSVMQTCASLARSELPEESPATRDLADLQVAIERAAVLTKQLLAFSRRDVVAPSRVDVGEVVRPVVDMVRRLLDARVEVRLAVAPGAHTVRAAASQLEQVVMNLAVNARDAMPDGGLLELRVEPARDEALGEVVRLSVRDTGSGMSEEVRARIFEPFFTTKPPGRGTGLGLATVYGVVRSLGGRVDVETALGKGTEFRVLIPRTPEGSEGPARQASAAARPVLRVLVVDDEPAVRSLMVKVLAGSGLEVREVGTPADALAALDAGFAPDVLVTDVMLPGMDGAQLAEKCLARVSGLRVVLVSGFAPDPAATERLVARGAQFLAKPFTPAALLTAVSQAAVAGPAEGASHASPAGRD
ncbi:MAG: ATP-binding protein [Myxococcota bacterium]